MVNRFNMMYPNGTIFVADPAGMCVVLPTGKKQLCKTIKRMSPTSRYGTYGILTINTVLDSALPYRKKTGNKIEESAPPFYLITEETEEDTVAIENALQTLYNLKMEEVYKEKVRVRDSGIIVGGILYDTDAPAMSAYTRTQVFVFNNTPDATIQNWKASDGVWVEMTKPLIDLLIVEGFINESRAFSWQAEKERQLKAALDSKSMEELSAISTKFE